MLVTENDYINLPRRKKTSIAYPTTTTIIAYRTSHFDTQWK